MTLITPSTLDYLEDVGRTLGGAWQRVLLREIGLGVLIDMGAGEWPVKTEVPLERYPQRPTTRYSANTLPGLEGK